MDQTYSSLESILGLERKEINRFLDSCEPDKDLVPDPENWARNVFNRLKEERGVTTSYDGTCWFHFTRLPHEKAGFSQGLRPLQEALPDIIDWLQKLAGGKIDSNEWKNFRKDVLKGRSGGHHLSLRHGEPYQQGPIGGLVRDFAFYISGKRDYFRRIPEAIEDLIKAVEYRFGIDLSSEFAECSDPLIVKFQTPVSPESNLSTALYYLLTVRRGRDLICHCNTYYSAGGQIIPRDDIIQIEKFLDPPALRSRT